MKPKQKNCPKRLSSPLDMLKYFINTTTLHGIKYSLDEQLYKVEKIFWVLAVFMAIFWAVKTIILIQNKYEVSSTFDICMTVVAIIL